MNVIQIDPNGLVIESWFTILAFSIRVSLLIFTLNALLRDSATSAEMLDSVRSYMSLLSTNAIALAIASLSGSLG